MLIGTVPYHRLPITHECHLVGNIYIKLPHALFNRHRCASCEEKCELQLHHVLSV